MERGELNKYKAGKSLAALFFMLVLGIWLQKLIVGKETQFYLVQCKYSNIGNPLFRNATTQPLGTPLC